jgi:hypothetical protein
MGLPPLLHLVRNIRDPGAPDERQTGILQLFEVGLRHHPRIGDHGHLRQPVRDREGLDDGDDRLGLGGVAVERVLENPGSRNPSPRSVSKYNVVTSYKTRGTGSRRKMVRYPGGPIPSSASTRIESSLLVGSTSRASTS